MIKLVIFDVDGTLARAFTKKILPQVKEFFQLLLRSGCAEVPKVAIATNQGGIGMRYWMEKSNFGNPEKYPSAQEIEQRLNEIISNLGGNPEIPVYKSYRYQTREGDWSPVPAGEADIPRWDPSWRKPQPGMLIQAIEDARVSKGETLFIGDSPDDRQAAQSAGCQFIWADDFFAREWDDCETLKSIFSPAE